MAEPRYVVDLRIDQPGEELADAGDRLQQLDVGIGLGHRPDRCFRLLDPHVDVADEGETTVNLDAVDLRDVHLSQLDAAGLAKQVAKLLQLRRLLRIAVEHRDDPVLRHRAQPHVKHPLAQRDAKVPRSLAWRPGFGYQIGSEQMCQNRRVDLVGLDLGVGDRLDLQRMGENDIITNVVEPVVHHHPVARRLDNRMRVLPIAFEKPAQRLSVVLHPAGSQRLAAAVLNHQVAVGFVIVDPDMVFIRGSHASNSLIEIFETPIG